MNEGKEMSGAQRVLLPNEQIVQGAAVVVEGMIGGIRSTRSCVSALPLLFCRDPLSDDVFNEY